MLKQAGHRWVFIWAITVLLLYTLIWFFGVSQMQTNRSQMQQQIRFELATLQPVTPSRTVQTPDTLPSDEVVAGVYINQIGNISVKDVSFKVDFDLWFRWHGTTLDPVNTFQLIDGEVESKEKVASVIRGEEHYNRYRIIAQVNKSFDTSRFPFSDEWFLIHIELGDSAKRTTQFIADQQASGQSALAVPPALLIRQTLIGVKLLNSPSTFGDPRLASKQAGVHSRLTYAMQVQPASVRIYVAIFQALFGAVAIALLACFIKPIHVDPRFGLGVGAFFAAVSNNVFVSNSLPYTHTITLSSLVNLVGLITIFLTLVQSTISLYLYDTKEMTHLSRFFDKVSFVTFLIGYTLVNLALPLAARSS